MSLWVKRAKAESNRRNALMESINRVMPMPFEERRSKVGWVSYRSYRWMRWAPIFGPPMIIIGALVESRGLAYENALTPLHLWLADQGCFRHDSIKALNPAYEIERSALFAKENEKRYIMAGEDLLSPREVRAFGAMNIEHQRKSNQFGI